MFPTNKAKTVLSEPNNMMQNLGETIENHRIWKLQSPFENDQFYLSKLVNDTILFYYQTTNHYVWHKY
jgi:hypothetical protein